MLTPDDPQQAEIDDIKMPQNTAKMTLMQANEIQDNDLDYAVDVLNQEAAGIIALSKNINGDFVTAVDIMEGVKKDGASGRIIVSGVGKSGHIGRKVAATLASTGTPSYYVHPGEASHGDLGMITENDVVIIFSNSGENSELSDLIFYTRRFSIPLIAVTSNPKSALAEHADVGLIMPPVKEACPNGMAPTTSTTMMLALGDTLALVLLKRMGLSKEQYKVFHPGGKLGQKLLTVAEMMLPREDMAMAKPGDTMDKTLLAMTEKNIGSVVVENDDGKVAGIITDGDLKRHMGPDLLQKTAREIMSTGPKHIRPNALAVEAIDIMLNKYGQPITSLIVLDEQDRLQGIIRIQDCLRAGIV